MNKASDIVSRFFEDYQQGIDGSNYDLLGGLYGESFMFAGPQGAQSVKRDDFLKMLPKRSGFFKAIGLTSSKIKTLEETRLDDHYIMAKVYWTMRFEKDSAPVVSTETSATYILQQQADTLQIVFQLDHQDLTQRVQELGLWSRPG